MFHPLHYHHYYHRRIYGYWGYWGPFWGGWYDWDYYHGDWPFYCGLRGVVVQEAKPGIPEAPPAPIETALKKMSVSIVFEGSAVKTVVEQTYVNQTSNPLEVTFSIGIGKRMAVSGFEATVGKERILGKIKAAEEALQIYDDSISAGHTPMLGERSAEGSFNMSLGNLQPKQEISIRVELLTEIEQSEDGSDSIFFGLPEAMFPAKHVVYDLALSVAIAFPGGCKKVKTLCNEEEKIEEDIVSADDYKYSRNFEAGKPCVKGMFAVEFSPKKSFEPCCTFEESPLDAIKYAALLSFTPDWSAVDQHALAPCVEVFFLIDRSGSMGDSKDGAKKRIVQAKEAMSIFLSSLPEGSKFQIIGFGSRYSLLFNNGSQPLNEKTLKQANEHVARLQADMGGTALLEPLEVALEEVASSEFPRIIFVLTDGNVENTEEVLKLVRTQAKTTRCFAIGLGADADEKLVNGLAKAGRGLADFVSDDATGNLSLQTVVVRQLARALEPTLRKPFISWTGCKPARISPDVLPAVLNGDRLLVYAHDVKLETADPKQIAAVVTGLAPDSSVFSQTVVSRHTVGTTISKLAAWKEILNQHEHLEQLEEQLKKARPKSRQFTEATAKITAAKAAIKALGLKFELATKFTSWIAVHENTELTSGSMVNVAIPSLNDPKKEAPKEAAKPAPVATTTTTTTATYFHDYHYDYVGAPYSSVKVVSTAAPAAASSSHSSEKRKEERSSEPRQQQQQQYEAQPSRKAKQASAPSHRANAPPSGPSSYSSSHGDDEECESSSSSLAGRGGGSSSSKSKKSSASSSSRDRTNESPAPPPPSSSSAYYSSAPSARRYYSHSVTTWEDMSDTHKEELLVKTRGNPEEIVPIAKLQDASGAWQVAALLNFFPEAKELMGKKTVQDDVVWATALAIAFLMKRKPDDEPTWTLLVQKGRQFVRKYLISNRLMNTDAIQDALKLL